MLSHAFRDRVLVASNVGLAGRLVLIHVVLCLQKPLCILDMGIKLDPLLVGGLADLVFGDTSGHKPTSNGVDGFRAGGEEVVDLFWRVPLAIVLRVMARAVSVLALILHEKR